MTYVTGANITTTTSAYPHLISRLQLMVPLICLFPDCSQRPRQWPLLHALILCLLFCVMLSIQCHGGQRTSIKHEQEWLAFCCALYTYVDSISCGKNIPGKHKRLQ